MARRSPSRSPEPGARSPEPGARSPEPGDLRVLLAGCRQCCERRGLSDDLTDELTQILALAWLEGRCRGIEHPAAWVRTFVVRQAQRLRLRQLLLPLQAEPVAADLESPSAGAPEMLKRLPFRLRRALELRYLECASADEAAAELHASVNAYRKLCERARRLVRQRSQDFLA